MIVLHVNDFFSSVLTGCFSMRKTDLELSSDCDLFHALFLKKELRDNWRNFNLFLAHFTNEPWMFSAQFSSLTVLFVLWKEKLALLKVIWTCTKWYLKSIRDGEFKWPLSCQKNQFIVIHVFEKDNEVAAWCGSFPNKQPSSSSFCLFPTICIRLFWTHFKWKKKSIEEQQKEQLFGENSSTFCSFWFQLFLFCFDLKKKGVWRQRE